MYGKKAYFASETIHIHIMLLNTLLRWACIGLGAATLAGCSPRYVVTPAAEPEPITFTILQLNDVYEIAPLEGGRVGGLARVATLLKRLEAENPNTIAILAGDFLSPSFAGTLRLDNGERVAGLQMVETLNAMGLDYVTFGNHEFDLRDGATLQSRIDASQFRWISCNALRVDNGVAAPFRQYGADLPPYWVHTFRRGADSLRVGFVGVVLPFAKAEYVKYLPVEQAYAEAYAQVAPKADIVIGITHQSLDEDEALAKSVPGSALFIGGHEHENLTRYVEQTPITKADANAKTVYVHRFVVDPRTGLARLRSTLAPIDAGLPDDPATLAVVNRWQERINGILQKEGYQPDRKLGEAQTPLEGREVAVRNQQTNYGLLTARSFADALPGADVYLLNSGSLRVDDKLSGVITEYDVLRSFPFGGPIVRTQWPGEVLARVLNTGATTNQGEGGYLQRFQAQPDGNGGWMINGAPLTPEKTYSVVLPEFVAQGKEANLAFLANYPYDKPEQLKNGLRNDVRNVVMAYMAALGTF